MSQEVRYSRVSAELAGQRLDNYLSRILGRIPKAAIYRIVRRGEVRVNGGRKSPYYRLQVDDEVRIPPVREGATASSEAPLPVGEPLLRALAERILYEDVNLLVLNKPTGLAVHGGSGINLGVLEALRQLRPGPFLELIHRIDRGTSGCLALAKSRSALLIAQQAFRDQRVRKQYVLLVEGNWKQRLQSVDAPLRRRVNSAGERRVQVDPVHGKPSRTDFERLRERGDMSWLKATPKTGRTHQIRVHAAQQGHPILGDDKYGTQEQRAGWERSGVPRLCLHAERLRLPFESGLIDVRAPVPEVFERIWSEQLASRPGTPSRKR